MVRDILQHYLPIDIIRTIRDPEEPGTLEELQMVNEDFVEITSIFIYL
jgi:hypothetical protein